LGIVKKPSNREVKQAATILSRYTAAGRKRKKWLESLVSKDQDFVRSFATTDEALSACAGIIGVVGGSVAGIQKGLSLVPKARRRRIQAKGGRIGGKVVGEPKGFANMDEAKEKRIRLAAQEAKREKYAAKLAAMPPAEREKALRQRAAFQRWRAKQKRKA
jgi:hypothetical protein